MLALSAKKEEKEEGSASSSQLPSTAGFSRLPTVEELPLQTKREMETQIDMTDDEKDEYLYGFCMESMNAWRQKPGQAREFAAELWAPTNEENENDPAVARFGSKYRDIQDMGAKQWNDIDNADKQRKN